MVPLGSGAELADEAGSADSLLALGGRCSPVRFKIQLQQPLQSLLIAQVVRPAIRG